MRRGGNAAWHLSASYWVWTEPPPSLWWQKLRAWLCTVIASQFIQQHRKPTDVSGLTCCGDPDGFQATALFPSVDPGFVCGPSNPPSDRRAITQHILLYVYHDCVSGLTDIHVFLAIELPKISFKSSNLFKKILLCLCLEAISLIYDSILNLSFNCNL